MGTHGAYARNHPKSVQWKVDYDYVAKLSDEDKAWLAKFTDEFVGGDLRHSDPVHDTPELRRLAYAGNNVGKRDFYSKMDAMGKLDRQGVRTVLPPDAHDAGEDAPAPAYLAYPGYKRALARLRALYPDDQRRGLPDTPEVRAARADIERIVRLHQGHYGDDETPETPEGYDYEE